jgi:chromosome segregation ATPase
MTEDDPRRGAEQLTGQTEQLHEQRLAIEDEARAAREAYEQALTDVEQADDERARALSDLQRLRSQIAEMTGLATTAAKEASAAREQLGELTEARRATRSELSTMRAEFERQRALLLELDGTPLGVDGRELRERITRFLGRLPPDHADPYFSGRGDGSR